MLLGRVLGIISKKTKDNFVMKGFVIRFVYMFLFFLLVQNLLAFIPFFDRFFPMRFSSFGIDFVLVVVQAFIMGLGFAFFGKNDSTTSQDKRTS